ILHLLNPYLFLETQIFQCLDFSWLFGLIGCNRWHWLVLYLFLHLLKRKYNGIDIHPLILLNYVVGLAY
ncbi:MAG: hypothetical protein EBR82_74765, partial [Caulobacteraceae bacterium]|nr:hypothetical protein [Caulobacteraceae bacterium]